VDQGERRTPSRHDRRLRDHRFAEIPKGWRLRVTLTTSDTPHLVPSLVQVPNLVGGLYDVQRRARAASFVNFPLAPASAFTKPCGQPCS
jgi:hypothetical protein